MTFSYNKKNNTYGDVPLLSPCSHRDGKQHEVHHTQFRKNMVFMVLAKIGRDGFASDTDFSYFCGSFS
jgi:hypothetical protein